jgi:hypothetical protein
MSWCTFEHGKNQGGKNMNWSKCICVITVLALVPSPALARDGHSGGYSHSSRSYSGVHTVRSYTRTDGTFVHSYHATNPNHTRNDNFSTRGNVNPYTGKAGTKPRDGEQ